MFIIILMPSTNTKMYLMVKYNKYGLKMKLQMREFFTKDKDIHVRRKVMVHHPLARRSRLVDHRK